MWMGLTSAMESSHNYLIRSIERGETTIVATDNSEADDLAAQRDNNTAFAELMGVRSLETSISHAEDIAKVTNDFTTNPGTITLETNSANAANDRIYRWQVTEPNLFAVNSKLRSSLSLVSGELTKDGALSGINGSFSSIMLVHDGSTSDNNSQGIPQSRSVIEPVTVNNVPNVTVRRASSTGALLTQLTALGLNPEAIDGVVHETVEINDGSASGVMGLSAYNLDYNLVLPFYLGFTNSDGFQSDMIMIYLDPGNNRMAAEKISNSGDGEASFCLVKLRKKWVKSKQRGTIVIPATGVSEADATVTAVTAAKSHLAFLGFKTDASGSGMNTSYPTLELVDSTTVRAKRASVSAVVETTVSWELTEFY